MALFLDIGDSRAAAAMANLGHVPVLLGRVADGVAMLRDGQEIAHATGNRLLESDCLAALANAYRREGQPALGVEHAEAALRLAMEADGAVHIVLARIALAEANLARGRLDTAREQGLRP